MKMASRNDYLHSLQKEYLGLSKKKKGALLDEAEKRTNLNRKCLIRKLSPKYRWSEEKRPRKRRSEYYNGEVRVPLVKLWQIFDYPCGQRLASSLAIEVDRLREMKELQCSDEVAEKLKKISARSIDIKLEHQKEVELMKRKYHRKINPLLYQKIPVKLSDRWDRAKPGSIQIDLVEHCGRSTREEYLCTLSTTDISTNWWEGEAPMGKGQERVFRALKRIRSRYPFNWQNIHSDNGSEFINWHLYHYIKKEKLEFSRSRPNKKNDNCFVEQKNWTHVKKFVGYLRYDSKEEQEILNDLYRNELRLYKNFFQPVIKLISRERIGGKIKRKYDIPKTPYQRALESKKVPENNKRKLKKIYQSLNPVKLKKAIDQKLSLLYQTYQAKQGNKKALKQGKLKPVSVTYLTADPGSFR
jgi:hypothetical protein